MNAVEISKKLEKMYKLKPLTSGLNLKTCLFGVQMTEEADFNKHYDVFIKLTMELASSEVRFEQDYKALLLPLPPSLNDIFCKGESLWI